jgi:hypothetical protein
LSFKKKEVCHGGKGKGSSRKGRRKKNLWTKEREAALSKQERYKLGKEGGLSTLESKTLLSGKDREESINKGKGNTIDHFKGIVS